MVSATSAMFESIALHITGHESPVSFESAKENTPSPAKHTSKADVTKKSKTSITQGAKESTMEQLPTSDPTTKDIVFERHIYVSHSGTTLDGPSSMDSGSAGPSRESRASHATDVLGRSLKDAMVIDLGVMTVMCFAGSPLKRDDTFDRSIISGNEEASLITIQNLYMETPETSPRESPIHLLEPNVISVKTTNTQDRTFTHLSALHMPLTAMFAQQQVLTVISDEGPDDEDIELNCNVAPSPEIQDTVIHENRGDIYPQYFSSDSKSPSVTSTLTSGSVSFLQQKIAVTLGDDKNNSSLGEIILKKNASSTYAHGCFPSQANTNLDSSSHGSSVDGNSTASTTPSTTLTSLVDIPVVKPSTWNELFCNINAGIQIFDFDDPDAPLALGCMSPKVESQRQVDSETSKSGDYFSPMALPCSEMKTNEGGMTSTCEESKEPSFSFEESMEDTAKNFPNSPSNNDSAEPLTATAMVQNNVIERKTFDAILSNMERLTAFERVVSSQGNFDNQEYCSDESHPSDVHDVESTEDHEGKKQDEQLLHQRSESVGSLCFEDTGKVDDTVHEIGEAYEGTSHEVGKTQNENVDEVMRLQKEEEEAIRKAYYLHRRQLYLEAHAKANAASEPRSFDDNDSEERPFDCGGPSKATASKPITNRPQGNGTKAQAINLRSTNEDNVSSSVNATYRQRKFTVSPRTVIASGSNPSKTIVDNPTLPQNFQTSKIHPLLQEMARDQGDQKHTLACSSESMSSHLKIPSHPGSSEEIQSNVGSPKNTPRSEKSIAATYLANCRQKSNTLRLTDPGNRINPRPTASQAISSKTSFQSTIDTNLTGDTENRQPFQRTNSARSTSKKSDEAQQKSGTQWASDANGKNSKRASPRGAPDSWIVYQQKHKTTQEVIGTDTQKMRQSQENLEMASERLHPKSFQRTTIASLAAASGISQRFTNNSNLVTDSGSSHHRTTNFGSTHDRRSIQNKSTGLTLATESGSSLESTATPSEGNSSHHRRIDRLNYLKMVRGVKVATRQVQ